ncbi:hypothetical protein HMPREF0602_0702 [Neisseria meningitidis ATCC 13091]|uniref:Uncharacterized protein n=1 Tax=Neisseria meningitidis serogroup B (strain ATCC 13091 / M2091) TaxID=862513 RepID=E0N872_NEIM3|nr:hypothetical protein HMPREF0602_0702 [Neisseria meningitidis ATCC 13091]
MGSVWTFQFSKWDRGIFVEVKQEGARFSDGLFEKWGEVAYSRAKPTLRLIRLNSFNNFSDGLRSEKAV